MCYICEAKGHVGANYKATQKVVAAAKRALGRVPGQEMQHCWGTSHDWTKMPTKRLWGADSLKAYAKGVTS